MFESPLPRILCAKIGWNWPSGSWVKILNRRQCIFDSLCGCYLPLEKCMVLKLNKLGFPLPKKNLCHVWLKFTHWFWRQFSKVVSISICSNYLLLGKGQGPLFKRNSILLTLGFSVPSLVEIGLVVLKKYFHYVAIISLWKS